MKRMSLVLSCSAVMALSSNAQSVEVERDVVSFNVDTIVAQIEGGKDVSVFRSEEYDPYTFIMDGKGNMIIHPTLAGQSLEKNEPDIFQALKKASEDGIWIEQDWHGETKRTYIKRTTGDLIVGSSY